MKSKWKFIASIAVPSIGGTIVGNLATRSAKEKYRNLKKPDFALPNWVFPVAWTSLYNTTGVAKFQFDKQLKQWLCKIVEMRLIKHSLVLIFFDFFVFSMEFTRIRFRGCKPPMDNGNFEYVLLLSKKQTCRFPDDSVCRLSHLCSCT